MIRAILACDDEWGIGKSGTLPWPHNAADLKWFKEKTSGGIVAMGKATWDSLPKKPLPGRNNIVITSKIHEDYDAGGYHCIKFENAAASLISMNKLQDVWIIGGAQLVVGLMDIIDEFVLSRINGVYECDTFLPRTTIEELFYLADSGVQGDVYVDVWRKL